MESKIGLACSGLAADAFPLWAILAAQCSVSLAITEMQANASLRFHLIAFILATTKKQETQGYEEPLYTNDENQVSTATMKISMKGPKKWNWPSYATFGYLFEGIKLRIQYFQTHEHYSQQLSYRTSPSARQQRNGWRKYGIHKKGVFIYPYRKMNSCGLQESRWNWRSPS